MDVTVLSKSQQVERSIRRSISRGKYSAGQKLPPERKLLETFGVNRSTLREALIRLSNDGLILRKHGVGTFIADFKNTYSISVVTDSKTLLDRRGCFYSGLIQELMSYVEGAGYRLRLAIGRGDTPDEFYDSTHFIEESVSKNTIGIVGLEPLGELANRFLSAGIKVVSIVSGVAVDKYSVVADTRKMGELASEVFRRRGLNEFDILFSEPLGNKRYGIETEYDSMRMALVGNCKDRLLSTGIYRDFDHVYELFSKRWKSKHRPKAILAYDMGICEVLLSVVLAMKIKVPDDLSILTVASKDREFLFPIPVTTLEYDPKKLVSSAWGLLEDLIEDREPKKRIIYIEPSLKLGKTVI